jgi:predicted Zn-dependent peptidase
MAFGSLFASGIVGMNNVRSLIVFSFMLLLCCSVSRAQERSNQYIEKRYNIFFRINSPVIDKSFQGNERTIETMREDIQTTLQLDGAVPDSLLILSTASPDGGYEFNKRLAKNRAASTEKLLLEMFPEFKGAHIKVEYLEEDWDGLLQVLKAHPEFPQREEMMEVIYDNNDLQSKEYRLRALKKGWRYLVNNYIYALRNSSITLSVVMTATNADDEFVREKQVVLEEIKMYADEPDAVAMENLQRALFPNIQLGAPVAGSEKSLAPMTRKNLLDYVKSHYLPGNTVAVVVGKFNCERALGIISDRLGQRRPRPTKDFKISASSPLAPVTGEVTVEKDVNQVQLAIGYRTPGITHKNKYAASVMNAILGRGMSSRLFQEVREKRGLSYDIASNMQMFQDAGMFVVTAGLDRSKTQLALKTIDAQLKRIREKKVPAAELARTKEFLLGNFKLSQERIVSKLFFYGSTMLSFGRLMTTREQIDAIRAVTAADVLETAQEFLNPANRSISWVVPRV